MDGTDGQGTTIYAGFSRRRVLSSVRGNCMKGL